MPFDTCAPTHDIPDNVVIESRRPLSRRPRQTAPPAVDLTSQARTKARTHARDNHANWHGIFALAFSSIGN